MKQGMIGKVGFVFGLLALNGTAAQQAHALAIPIKQDQIQVEYLDSKDHQLTEMHGYSLEWLGFGAEFPIANRKAEYTEEFKLPGHGTATVHLKMDSTRFEISFEGKSGTLLKKESCESSQVLEYIPNLESTTFYCGAEGSEHAFKVRITNLSARKRQEKQSEYASRNQSVPEGTREQPEHQVKPTDNEVAPSIDAGSHHPTSSSENGK